MYRNIYYYIMMTITLYKCDLCYLVQDFCSLSKLCAYNVATFKFKSHLRGVVILRPTFLVQDKMFRKFLKKFLKNLNSLKNP
jgi:hypothetical protein